MLSSYNIFWSQVAPSLFWFVIGVILCLLELFLPKALATSYKFVPLLTGVISLILAFLLLRANYVPEFKFQVLYWMGLSLASVLWVRPMFLKRKKHILREATEAKTVTEILPGETGRVVYEGCLWQACCDDRSITISPNQKVYVLRREGNTLIVAPENMFRS